MHQSSLDNMEKVIQELAPYLDKENDIFDLGVVVNSKEVIKVYGKTTLKNTLLEIL